MTASGLKGNLCNSGPFSAAAVPERCVPDSDALDSELRTGQRRITARTELCCLFFHNCLSARQQCNTQGCIPCLTYVPCYDIQNALGKFSSA